MCGDSGVFFSRRKQLDLGVFYLNLEVGCGLSRELGPRGWERIRRVVGRRRRRRRGAAPVGLCVPPAFSSHAPRVMGESCVALIAASVLGAAAAREEAEPSAFALRPCREPLRGG